MIAGKPSYQHDCIFVNAPCSSANVPATLNCNYAVVVNNDSGKPRVRYQRHHLHGPWFRLALVTKAEEG